MTLDECMKKHTVRQYRVWLAWLSEQETIPDKHDLYLAQVALEVRRLFLATTHQNYSNLILLDFILKKPEKPSITLTFKQKLQQATDWAKARWGIRVGKKL